MGGQTVDTANDLTGKVCIVTGANRGIGYATSVRLARAGAAVTLVGRDPARLEIARDEIRRTTGADRVDYLLGTWPPRRPSVPWPSGSEPVTTGWTCW
jgi:NAD(P)-dependent dehydrogenase (short-subunit alcohol dehydrogenase family)